MTNSAMGGGGILKRDKKGRVRSTAARRQEVLEQLERSGLSGPEFARVAGMPYQTLASWRQKHTKKALSLPRPRCGPSQHPPDGGGDSGPTSTQCGSED